MLVLKSQFPSFEEKMCKNYYEQSAKLCSGDQLCSGATETPRSVTHLVDQSASHRADKEVRAARKSTRRSQEFMKSLELAKRYRLCVTTVDYRTEVNCRFVCKCRDDDIAVTISHKSICLKNGDVCTQKMPLNIAVTSYIYIYYWTKFN